MHKLLITLALIILLSVYSVCSLRTHLYQMPSEIVIRKLAKTAGGSDDSFSPLPNNNNQSYLSPLLISRPAGSENLEQIRLHLSHFFRRLQWTVEWDNFTAETPVGQIRMANMIVTHRPHALRKLVLACHYDSKREPEGFFGATDSAAPMALLLSLAEWIGPLLSGVSGGDTNAYTVQLIFFDGEEAVKQWTATDSIYGSRNLHRGWSAKGTSIVPLEEFRKWPNIAADRPNGYQNRLEEIDLFILLDLLGYHLC